jgi:hypothetical protein
MISSLEEKSYKKKKIIKKIKKITMPWTPSQSTGGTNSKTNPLLQ